jgi:hypothetical protein
MIQK